MNVRRVCKWCVVTTLLALGATFGLTGSCSHNRQRLPRRPPGAEEGVQVLTRGPVHEAFAETVTYDPERASRCQGAAGRHRRSAA